MSDTLNLIKQSLLMHDIYIPSLKAEIKAKAFTIGQYNNLLSFTLTEEEYYAIQVVAETDELVKTCMEDTSNLLYFDKVFILNQIKLAQETSVFGITFNQYKENLRNACQELDLNSFDRVFESNGLEVVFSLNSFDNCYYLNQHFLNLSDQMDISTGQEMIRSVKYIKFNGEPVNFKDENINEVLDTIPASIIATYLEFNKNINDTVTRLNTINVEGEDLFLFPTIETLLL